VSLFNVILSISIKKCPHFLQGCYLYAEDVGIWSLIANYMVSIQKKNRYLHNTLFHFMSLFIYYLFIYLFIIYIYIYLFICLRICCKG